MNRHRSTVSPGDKGSLPPANKPTTLETHETHMFYPGYFVREIVANLRPVSIYTLHEYRRQHLAVSHYYYYCILYVY